ncbi:MAG: L-histidine N(alpha)-methyltransferase [Gemmatimonadota bacterium]|nr:L-histidine N(alpha)-methyltransferase [Gemmatimonadota bacterium]
MTAPLDATRGGAFLRAGIADHALREEALLGLRGTPKTLPPKFFYDEVGALLFEHICTLDEYYLTRAELEIMEARAGEIAALAGPRCALIEYGSGAGVKVRLLLDALEEPVAYVPIDISREQLAQVGHTLAARYPRVAVRPLCADYTTSFRLPALPGDARRLAFFPGSTIGNFHPAEAAAFLHRIRRTIGPNGALVLGVDRRKDERVLHAAYNDREGVTAAFNLNMLARLNRELDADFDLSRFRHRAFFDPHTSRVEMHLESLERQTACVAGEGIVFARGETIWTESSYKYDRPRLDRVTAAAGFSIERLWTDGGERFWVAFLTPLRTPADLRLSP